MKESQKFIVVKGARENNLKNIDIKIPKGKLVVFTGVSGSGKSSLAFNTIYEEGRRRYVDSLSSYARQFLGGTKKPLVDSIDGLSPAISIEQKSTHNNPRSTVGTVTEIYDYLRLLYARVGKAYCPNHNIEITAQKMSTIIEKVFAHEEGTKLIILAPIVKKEKGTHSNLFERLRREGFLRVRVNGVIQSLDDDIVISKTKQHEIDLVVDRIVLKKEDKSRITEAVELAMEFGKGIVKIDFLGKGTETFSKHHSCKHGDFDMPIIEPRLFSFNSPSGMCEECKGLGVKLKTDINKLIPNMDLSINQGGIVFFKNLVGSSNLDWQAFKELCKHYRIDLDMPIKTFSKYDLTIILEGSDEEIEYTLHASSGNKHSKLAIIEGVSQKIERRYHSSSSEQVRSWYRKTFMSDITCNVCGGKRLNKFATAVRINNRNINQFTELTISDSLTEIIGIEFSDEEKKIVELVINELSDRLQFLNNVGLDYLSLNRKAETLSGGEAQRIRLATQIGSNLTGVLYVLDEPSIGLHQKDNEKLIKTLKQMVDIGNTLIVVEHDEETIRSAEHIVEIGPKAGIDG
ncbi:MAG: excinuclease ABC subunit UvrA, partial [Mycoplasmataceae bacterium]|nr:excinuclease ABC subunit UvrA [Mycoplasmataceae bacterium]